MKRLLFLSFLITIFFSCKKREISDIGIELNNPREGLVIQFNGNTNRLYFVKANIRSEKALDKVVYQIVRTSNNQTVSAFLEDSYTTEKDVTLDISEYMPSGAAFDAKITLTVTDVSGYSQTKTANFRLVP